MKSKDEVYVLAMRRVGDGTMDTDNGQLVEARGYAYNVKDNTGRIAGEDEASPDIAEFITEVRTDMDSMGYGLVMTYASEIYERGTYANEEDRARELAAVHMKLMHVFDDRPAEFLSNMIAAYIVGTIESAIEDQELPALLADWEETKRSMKA